MRVYPASRAYQPCSNVKISIHCVSLRLRNDTVVEIIRRYPKQFIGFASVDPHKGDRASAEAHRAVRELGLSGMKFHPDIQALYPNDPLFAPLFATVAEFGVPALFHTGTSGLGANMPSGGGVKLDYTRPIYLDSLDSLAVDFPTLTIIDAHPLWP